MKRARFAIPDLPADRPKVPGVSAKVRAYYAMPDNGAGGHCHVVLDDGNIDLHSCRWCLALCWDEGDAPGIEIMEDFLRMTSTQRRKVHAIGG